MKHTSLITLIIFTLTQFACQSQSSDISFAESLKKSLSSLDITDNDECPTDSFDIVDCSDKILDEYLDSLLCDGFDYPIGNKNGKGSYVSALNGKTYYGWKINTPFLQSNELNLKTGVDWKGIGGQDTDLNQPVFSIAQGIVVFANTCKAPWGKVIIVEYRYIENGKVKQVYAQYAHLQKILVKKGQVVKRREQIATLGASGLEKLPPRLHLEIRKASLDSISATYNPLTNDKDSAWITKNYFNPIDFINSHRTTVIPQTLPQLVIAIKSSYKLLLLEKGELKAKYEIALSQRPNGHKEKQGDLRLPEGAYRLCQKTKGPFKGSAISAYFGPAWMRVSYPNNFDAKVGLETGLIEKWQYNTIVQANNKLQTPPKTTKLGGGIGIHGWVASDWANDDDRHLTWGCISMHNDDLKLFFEQIKLNAPIYILP